MVVPKTIPSKSQLSEFKERLFNLENKSLECNLIFRGGEEPLNETPEGMKERLYWMIADISISNKTCCLCGALRWTEGTWHMDQSTMKSKVGHR